MRAILQSTTMPRAPSDQIRTLGVHLSNCLAREKGYDTSDSKIATDWMNLGSLFEYAFIAGLKAGDQDAYTVPPELCLDDIFMHPDLFHIPSRTVTEVKFTSILPPTLPEGYDGLPIVDDCLLFHKTLSSWLDQLKGYCKAMNTVNGRLVAAFIPQHYTAILPFRDWQITFTQRDLDRNWTKIKSLKRLLEQE